MDASYLAQVKIFWNTRFLQRTPQNISSPCSFRLIMPASVEEMVSEAPFSEVIDASERTKLNAEETALIPDHDQCRNYGFVGEIIIVSEETLSELKGIIRKSKHKSIDDLLDCFHSASGSIEFHVLCSPLLHVIIIITHHQPTLMNEQL